jgi:hypothetical protein
VKEHLVSTFEGEMIEFCETSLAQKTDLARIRKIYKLHNPARAVDKKQEDPQGVVPDKHEVALSELEMSILGLMALRGAG